MTKFTKLPDPAAVRHRDARRRRTRCRSRPEAAPRLARGLKVTRDASPGQARRQGRRRRSGQDDDRQRQAPGTPEGTRSPGPSRPSSHPAAVVRHGGRCCFPSPRRRRPGARGRRAVRLTREAGAPPGRDRAARDLAQEREDALRALVGLGQHRRAGLREDLQLVKFTISWATSTSRMRLSEAAGSPASTPRLAIGVLEPVLHGTEVGADVRDVGQIAVSIVRHVHRDGREVDSASMSTPTRFVLLAASTFWLAPTWIVTVVPGRAGEQRDAVELRAVADADELGGQLGDLGRDLGLIGRSTACRSANCTLSSRTRCRIACISFSAPSAVWTSEMPSWALRLACAVPRIWARMPSEIARPAASSAARLMRRPRRELLHRLRQPDRRRRQIAVGVERLDVGVDPKRHEILLDPGGLRFARSS